ncbi:hypothetical protein BKA62DRAFT_712639 [Auriculariales sp. MPI-PUGE-AT-0066]|nr:hypothetical protein BKA62DRAFT_723458 [Auriculariales sp. MPI-PUGE-AT-0066]KAH7098673.1 hypothetical protein BKA62DRAFT_712639 [Auriculariales sp. MPI-PUGE-AT-0066]
MSKPDEHQSNEHQQMSISQTSNKRKNTRIRIRAAAAAAERHMASFFHDEFVEAKMQPNAIPSGAPDIKGPHRTVSLAWHPVAGFAGSWFAEQTGLGKLISTSTKDCPDPTQHWGVLVGDYAHQLWMDEHLDVIYTNEKVDTAIWKHSFEVGHTRFSDEALRQAAEMTIHGMREHQAAYNLISNNCQVFALRLLDAIQIGKHREFATSFEVYRAAVGPGAVVDLFKVQADELPPPEVESEGNRPPEHVMQDAKKVMDENTTKLDEHHKIF